MKDNDKKFCLYPKCGNNPVGRGLCYYHYAVAKRLVQKGHASWEELEKMGKCRPTNFKANTGSKDWFLDLGKL